jgi:hypothetical protein
MKERVGPGVHEISESRYHADPCAEPSLSASVAHKLIANSPLHAWAAHPLLNPGYVPEEAERFDIGKAAHALLLEGVTAVEVVDANDWRTTAAQEARAEARAAGRFPLLAKQWGDVQAMVEAARIQLNGVEATPLPFTDGKPEQTLIWQEPTGVTCRARLDWLRDDHTCIDDYKTTSRTANPEQWSRSLFGMGCDVQAAFYLRGLKTLTGTAADWRWVVQETTPPYALSVITLTPAAMQLAEAKVEHAIAKWAECLEADQWPGYPLQLCHAELPSYEEARWLEREEKEYA